MLVPAASIVNPMTWDEVVNKRDRKTAEVGKQRRVYLSWYDECFADGVRPPNHQIGEERYP